MSASWLLIVVAALNSSAGGRGVTAVLVTEAQCKAAVNWLNPSWHTIVCISPEGKTFTKQEPQDGSERR
jgi:hypothetical protein